MANFDTEMVKHYRDLLERHRGRGSYELGLHDANRSAASGLRDHIELLKQHGADAEILDWLRTTADELEKLVED